MVWWAPLLAMAGQEVLKKVSGDADRKAARKLQEEANARARESADMFRNLQDPRLEEISFEEYATPENFSADTQIDPALMEAVGYDPSRLSAEMLGPSTMESLKSDQALRGAQQQSLAALQDIAARGGRSLADEANLQRLQGNAAASARGNRDAAIAAMRAQGTLSGGNELLARLQANQDADMRTSQASMDAAGQAQDRALQAILQSGQLAGQMDDRDYGRQAQIASAKDMISRFNVQNKNDMAVRNAMAQDEASRFEAEAQNRAAAANMGAKNLASSQGLDNRRSDAMTNWNARTVTGQRNTDLRNKSLDYNKTQLPMTRANWQLQKAQGGANALQGLAGHLGGVANQRTITGAAKDDALVKIGSKVAEKAWDSYSQKKANDDEDDVMNNWNRA